jgi:prepilin-type N-terminal cleavage/methylation domain-containing protein/prepilin-type processing-associated H-X9-DG protein
MNRKTTHARSRKPCTRSAGGFTLVELLVTIVVIVVLAALVFTMTGKIRSKAQQANALTALRQVAGANVNYSIENNGDINTMRWKGDPKEGGGGAWVRNSFWGRAQEYLYPEVSINNQNQLKNELNQRLDSLFNSPDADKMAGTFLQGARIYHDDSGLPVPIAFNRNLHQWGQFLKTSSFGDPSRVLYATYGYGFFDDNDAKSYAPIPRDNSIPANKIYYPDNKQAMVSFLDGHVELMPPPIPVRLFK